MPRKIMNGKKGKFNKLIGVLLVAFTLISGFCFLFQTLFSPDYVVNRSLIVEYTQSGNLDYSAELKPNLIYEKEKISSSAVLYSALLKKMDLIYTYTFNPPPEELKGSYRITLLLSSAKRGWEKEIWSYSGKLSGSSFEMTIPIDWDMVNLMWKEIENETKYDFGDPNVRFVSEMNLSSRISGHEINENFLQSSNVSYGKIILLSEVNKTKKGAIYSNITSANMVGFLGFPIEARNLRLIFGIEFFAFTAFLGAFTFTNRAGISEYLSKREKRNFERKFRNRIVNTASFSEHSGAVKVLNLKDLAKLSYELDKPILKAENRFAVMDGESVYVYDDNIIIKRKQ
jgi:hypothetical protein